MALTQISEKGIKDGEIINADINASAAIAGTKIAPDFGSQDITTTGDLGIGTSSPSGGKLHIAHGNEFGLYTSSGYNYQAKFESTDAEAAIVIEDNGSTNDGNRIGVISDAMAFTTANSERMRIDSSGKVGIGTSSPDRTIHCHNSSNTTNVRTKFSNGTTGEGASDGFEIGINGSDPAQAVLVNYEASPIAFFTGGTERIRVDESGHLRFSGTTEEIKLNTSDGSDNGFLNLAGGGECSQLRGSQIVMYGNEYSGQEGQLLLMAGNSSNTNGVVRFYTGGSERARIQSGGGISFNGDTAAANALDDYEEGTWTPTFDGNTASNTANNCFYVKVGRVVTIFFRATMASSSSSSYANIANLPFTSVNSTNNIAGGAFSDSNAGENLHLGVMPNANYAYIIEIGASSTITRTQSSLSGKDFRGSITYMTT